MKFSSKKGVNVNCFNNNIINVNSSDICKSIVKIILTVAISSFFVAFAYRLLTVSDGVFSSILEKVLETINSGIDCVIH